MTKTSGIRRALAAVVGLALAGSLTAAAGAGSASAADDHLTSDVLLSKHDVVHAGWKDPSTRAVLTPEALLGQCSIELPYWAPGFRELQRREFEAGPSYHMATEIVLAFRTERDADDYADNYAFGVGAVCPDQFGKRWDVRSTKTIKLRDKGHHAETWRVRDTSGDSQSLAITLVRVHERIAIVWLKGVGHDDPARSLDLPGLVQRATDRVAA
jgi:hypothetical protein